MEERTGLRGVQEHERLAGVVHVRHSRGLESLLTANRSVEMESSAALDLRSQDAQEGLGCVVIDEREQTLVVIGAGHGLNAAGELLPALFGVVVSNVER
jgi:hypothetical protein